MNPFPTCLAFAALSCLAAAEEKPRVLILSGANNHDWKQTTPAIQAALEETGRFEVDVEENVIAMKPEAFASYAVVLGNFNTYGNDAPETKEWPAETRKAFLDHMAKGHGLVIVHAGSSVFYDWPEFQNLACGTWKDPGNNLSKARAVRFYPRSSPSFEACNCRFQSVPIHSGKSGTERSFSRDVQYPSPKEHARPAT